MGSMIAGSVLGARRGVLASLLFLVLVAIGLPLLAGGRGGFGVFLGPSGGFMIAYPFATFAIGLAFERLWNRINFVWAFIINVIGGIGIVYLFGIPWLSVAASLPFTKAMIGSAAFIPGDLLKAVIAAFIAVTVKKSYPIIETSRPAISR